MKLAFTASYLVSTACYFAATFRIFFANCGEITGKESMRAENRGDGGTTVHFVLPIEPTARSGAFEDSGLAQAG